MCRQRWIGSTPPRLVAYRIRAVLTFCRARGPGGIADTPLKRCRSASGRTASPLPDEERAQPLWLLCLGRDVNHDGQVGTVAHPVDETVNVVGRSLEDRLDPPVGKVASPPAHTMLESPSPAGVAEVDALDQAGDEHPIADHKQTLRGDWGTRLPRGQPLGVNIS